MSNLIRYFIKHLCKKDKLPPMDIIINSEERRYIWAYHPRSKEFMEKVEDVEMVEDTGFFRCIQ